MSDHQISAPSADAERLSVIDRHLREHTVPRRQRPDWSTLYGWEEKHIVFLRRLFDEREAELKRLRAEVERLTAAIRYAQGQMDGAPIWGGCQGPACGSYDRDRDVDRLFDREPWRIEQGDTDG